MDRNLALLYEQYKLILEKTVEKNPLTPKSFERFISHRAEGAAKIQAKAAEKGGYSTLTAIHFAAKAAPYAESEKLAEDESRNEKYKDKAEEIYKKLADLDSLSQEEFQQLMGELEVWGEVYIRSTKPKSLKI